MLEVRQVQQGKKYETEKLREGKVRVGFFSDRLYDDGVPVAKVARYNEFGTPTAPSRPFFRPAIHQNRTVLLENLRNRFRQALKNNEDTMNVLEQFGEQCASLIRRQIDLTLSPPNKPSTLRQKRGTHPLIDTGFMQQSVDYQVEETTHTVTRGK